jgi:hypothetical protein
MSTHRTIRTFAWLLVVPALVGCAANASEDTDKPATTKKQALWGCSLKSSSVVCTAALAENPSEKAAYACVAGDDGEHCPDADSVRHVAGLRDLLKRVNASDKFEQAPWACLLTGKIQHQCTRSLKKIAPQGFAAASSGGTDGADENGSMGGGLGDVPAEGAPVDVDNGNVQPTPPDSCEPSAWEPYFAKLATWSYNANGVDVAFPRDIFDTSANFTSVAVATGFVKSTPGAPSCHNGEWQMRDQAWLDAVGQGCMSLTDPILVMCQQAANYAPNCGACNATGTW